MNTLPTPAALIFDLDGTLIDSSPDLAAAANRTRAKFDLPPLPLETIQGYIGDGARNLVSRSLGGDEHLAAGLKFFRRTYHEHCLEETTIYDGIVSMLEGVGDLPCAVCTNKPEEMAEDVVRGLGLDGFFDVLVGARPGVPLKPAPNLLLLATEALDVPAAKVWMFGDSPNDVGAARAVGATAIGCRWGLDPQRLEASKPDALLHRPHDILPLLAP